MERFKVDRFERVGRDIMNSNFLVKNAFILTTALYGFVGWLYCVQNPTPDTDPSFTKMMLLILGGIYFLTIALIEPLAAVHFARKSGGYNQGVMILKLSLLQSGAVYGLFLTLLSKDTTYAFGFGTVAALLIAVRVTIPRKENPSQ